MNVCILGSGLVSLTLAKALINLGINVDIFSNFKSKNQNKIRTLGISKSNVDFINENILNIEKFLWNINRIEIYTYKSINEKLINFDNGSKTLFSLIKNYKLYNHLLLKINKNKLINFKNKKIDYVSIKDKYDLIINCDLNNQITKKYFYKQLNKDYLSYAHTTIIKHKKLTNHTATQIFTENGPFAFLPISENETSIVYSAKGKRNIKLKNFIDKYNSKYEIISIKDIYSFELKSSNLRSYQYKNILAFGDLLHRIHPLAGQGYNMSIRDINELIKLIKLRLDLGLNLDSSICLDFEKKIKHKNYIFSKGVDLIYEFFDLESKFKSNILSKSIQVLGKNKLMNDSFKKFANQGLII